MTESFYTPVLFLIFNRPEFTRKTFETIRAAKPKKLYVAADGPRKGKEGENELCQKCRDIISEIDWDCEVKTLFRRENLGCGLAVSGAITWFFENVEYGIILEDDCLPFPGFFSFCEDILERYKNDNRILEVCGTNLQGGLKRGMGSYYFSNYGGIWGWATWARAWKKYDYKMKNYNNFVEENKISRIFEDSKQQKYWIKTLNTAGSVDTWDYQWLFAIWYYNGLCIVPNVNLVRNIGFDGKSTHTENEPFWYKNLIKGDGTIYEIVHPPVVAVDTNADKFLFKNCFSPISLSSKTWLFIKKAIASIR